MPAGSNGSKNGFFLPKVKTSIVIGAALLIGALLTGCRVPPQTSQPKAAVETSAKGGGDHPPFRDVAAQAGIHFHHSNGATGKFYYIEITGSGCAFLDYDNDGYPDILLIQSGPWPRSHGNDPSKWCRLYHNQRDGTFKDVTVGSGLDRDLGYCQGVTIGDYDNDGYDDIFITGYGGNHLLRNEHGSGHFVDVTKKAGLSDTEMGPQYATSAAFGDYDNDGYLDLYVCHYMPWSIPQNIKCESPKGEPDYCIPTMFKSATHRLYHNNKDGTFTDVSKSSGIDKVQGRGLAVAWLDYDEDGREDIYVANDLTPTFLWHNDGGGHFTNRSLETGVDVDNNLRSIAAMGIAVGDYDNSGHESTYVSNFSGRSNELFHNLGAGQFEDATVKAGMGQSHLSFLTFGSEFIDYDADGWKDIINGDGHVSVYINESTPGVTYKERKQLYHNEGGGKFTEVVQNLGDLATPTVSRGLAVGDYDNDGRLDILVNNQNGLAQLFHNENQNGNHWVSFKTVGVKCNRDGYGARITARWAQQQCTSEVHSSSSYESHSDSRVYFGLGASTRLTSLSIRWPGGAVEEIKDIAADHCYVLTQGRGITGTLPQRK
ncbi:MAG: CRTAC1 family protein [Armatimonadota bacterium]|nr:CRTAC1 family protein [Armatimonadota bacterium]